MSKRPEAAAGPADDSDREIRLTRLINAPRDRVWDAWTDPRQIVKWWGPRDFTLVVQEMDVRPGGAWKSTMIGPDGAEYRNDCVFAEVERPARIAYALIGGRKGGEPIQMQASWTFEDEGERTRIELRMLFMTAEARRRAVELFGFIEGGVQTIARLQAHLASPVTAERT
ncbi:SRPBCC domain-containing protein [Phenylobacterium sp.]|jgi:uncharacterized protein YndB with AHSA1/START domain|uniref:SRPBCC domain-containing protein n=1 Tax=Phenylobacterium sp. TaxID=1871053 RepID=UPI002F42A1A8